jgi:hypothetical protein
VLIWRAHGGEEGVDGVAARMGQVVAAHSVIILEVADNRLDRGSAREVSFHLRCTRRI